VSAFNNANPTPTYDGVVPRCSHEGCPLYDGKRCEALGFRPDGICEPTVVTMGKRLQVLEAKEAKWLDGSRNGIPTPQVPGDE